MNGRSVREIMEPEPIASVGQIISDAPTHISDAEAARRAKLSISMKAAHARKPNWRGNNKSESTQQGELPMKRTYKKRRKRMGKLARKHMSQGQKLRYQRLREQKALPPDTSRMITSTLGASTVTSVGKKGLIELTAERLAEKLYKDIKRVEIR